MRDHGLAAPPPSCMTPDELERWDAVNRTMTLPALRACQDCQKWWAEAMRAVGRCNGEPGEPPVAIKRYSNTERRRLGNRAAQQRWRDRQRAMLTAARA